MFSDLLSQVYKASDNGLDIIKSVCPQAADAVGNRRNFKLRTEERTASAHLYEPNAKYDYWRVVDYGGGEGERSFSPIDLYMRSCGYTQADFALAVHELAERYGVQERLSSKANRPEITRRPASEEERNMEPRVTTREGFSEAELLAWGPRVKAEHLVELGWKAVASVERVNGGEVVVKKSTPTYPIFAQECPWQDADGLRRTFLKLYEPKNANKAFRFSIVGAKPRNYVFGLAALRRRFEAGGEEKLDEVILVSGGSDAANCLSMGYQPVWLGSETEELREEDYWQLMKYARRVVNIPDLDATGVKAGRRLALRFLGMHTAWLTPKDMGYLHDNRGRMRKDLKDFVQLHPDRKAMRGLVERAQCAQFWDCHEDKKNGQTQYAIIRPRLDYFLELNGFFTLPDDQRAEPLYVRIMDNVVRRIKAKHITAFLKEWMREQGLDENLQGKVLRSHDLPNSQSSTLRVRDDLDFTQATPEEQRFYFRNGWVRVTCDDITFHGYGELTDRYVWQESIIQHDYRPMPKMFSVVRREDGTYIVDVAKEAPSKLLQFVLNTSRIYWRKEEELGLELTDAEAAEEHQCMAGKLSALGYMQHRYKSESAAWAVLCQDAAPGESDDDCNGRSGKSFFLKAATALQCPLFIEARVPSIIDNRFIFDGVTEATDIVVVDECCKNLNYDFFFGKVSGDLRYEEKGNHPRLIPFAKSPKFAFATNFVLRRHDPSTEGRYWPQPFGDYYHQATKKNDYRETRSIRDDFGCNLMGMEYPEADWQADIAFLLQCLQFYLSLPVGERRIMPPMQRIERREQLADIGKDFRQWADEYFAENGGNLDRELRQDEVLNSFNGEATYKLAKRKFTMKLKEYCSFAAHIQCLNPAYVTGCDKDGERYRKHVGDNEVLYYYVQSVKGAAQADTELRTPVQGKLPF